jgi:uncharacterized protein with FMN-binding domain
MKDSGYGKSEKAKRAKAVFFIMCLAFGLMGCKNLSTAEIKAYLDGIPVTTPDLSAKPDGVYEGSYTMAMPPGVIAVYHSISVAVTVKAGRIESIAITKPRQLSDDEIYNVMVAGPSGIIAKQSLDVDAISGASFSLKALLKAVEDALSH